VTSKHKRARLPAHAREHALAAHAKFVVRSYARARAQTHSEENLFQETLKLE
jgi:hypothetical protein